MNCQNCNSPILPENNYCPSCGAKLNPQYVNPQNSTEDQLKKPSSRLFKILLSVLAVLIAGYIFVALTSSDMTNTVTAQLSSIKEGKITEAYYDYTSKAFQKATSLTKFREFLKNEREFAEAKSIRFVDRNVDSDSGILKARLLTSNDIETPIEYTLVKEDDQWKILNIKLETGHKIQENAFNKKPFEDPINGQLEFIRLGKLGAAYDTFTSESFKKATSLKQFEDFVKSQKGFSDNASLVLNELNFDNNLGKYSGLLKTKDQEEYPVEYDLVLENGVWKIMHIEVQKPSDDLKKNTLSISQVVLGNQVDASGVVTDPKTVFDSHSGDIYLNIHLINGKAGVNIEALLKHIHSDSFIAPVSTRLTEDGDANAIFIFSPPAAGWPEGEYIIKVSTTSGYSHSYNFKVAK